MDQWCYYETALSIWNILIEFEDNEITSWNPILFLFLVAFCVSFSNVKDEP